MLSVMVMGAGRRSRIRTRSRTPRPSDMCTALNIIGGYEDGSYHPERNIKRSEITKMICVALNGGESPTAGHHQPPHLL
ncbi:MAG: S-layer homology domain-containing protein [Evtepia gabavorous]